MHRYREKEAVIDSIFSQIIRLPYHKHNLRFRSLNADQLEYDEPAARGDVENNSSRPKANGKSRVTFARRSLATRLSVARAGRPRGQPCGGDLRAPVLACPFDGAGEDEAGGDKGGGIDEKLKDELDNLEESEF